mgnify:CR=1 FL=1
MFDQYIRHAGYSNSVGDIFVMLQRAGMNRRQSGHCWDFGSEVGRGRGGSHPCLPRQKNKLNEDRPPGSRKMFLRFVSATGGAAYKC